MVDRNPSLARIQKPDGSAQDLERLAIRSSDTPQDSTYTNLKPASQGGREPAGTEICKYGCTHTFRKGHIPGYPDVDDPKEQTFEPNGSFKFPKPVFGKPLLKRF